MPEAREMFRDDMANQGMQFLSTLRVVVDHIDDLDRIDGELRNLGRGHGAYGVRAEQYGPMGDALIETMRDTLGPEFDAEAQAAWRKAYEAVAARMQAAVA
jgi:nitric oxide dioxygenase